MMGNTTNRMITALAKANLHGFCLTCRRLPGKEHHMMLVARRLDYDRLEELAMKLSEYDVVVEYTEGNNFLMLKDNPEAGEIHEPGIYKIPTTLKDAEDLISPDRFAVFKDPCQLTVVRKEGCSHDAFRELAYELSHRGLCVETVADGNFLLVTELEVNYGAASTDAQIVLERATNASAAAVHAVTVAAEAAIAAAEAATAAAEAATAAAEAAKAAAAVVAANAANTSNGESDNVAV